MGPYGILRFNYPLLPDAHGVGRARHCRLRVINIIYAAFVCLAQTDLKKLIAYSSVSHMASPFSACGHDPGRNFRRVFNISRTGSSRPCSPYRGVIYDRLTTARSRASVGWPAPMPEIPAMTGLAFFASLGLPGMCGFILGVHVLTGTFPTSCCSP